VPLCGAVPLLAKVDLKSNRLISVFKTGPAAAEGGVAVSSDSVWLVTDKQGSLARIEPGTGRVRQITHLPAGSYNPFYSEGQIWVTRADGSEVTSVDASTGAILATVPTGPGPRFLTAGAGAVWTLNQGDGSVTRIDTGTRQATSTTALSIPGKGGDSLGIGHGAIWLTDYHAGTISRIELDDAMRRCKGGSIQ
jgi:streptogramin lyase